MTEGKFQPRLGQRRADPPRMGLPPPGRAHAVMTFLSHIEKSEEAAWFLQRVRERFERLEQQEITQKIKSEQWRVGDHITWMDQDVRYVGAIRRVTPRLVVVTSTIGETWHVNPLIAKKL